MFVQCDAKLFITIVMLKKFFTAKVFLYYTLCNKHIINPHKCFNSVIFFLYVSKHMNGVFFFNLLFIFKYHVGGFFIFCSTMEKIIHMIKKQLLIAILGIQVAMFAYMEMCKTINVIVIQVHLRQVWSIIFMQTLWNIKKCNLIFIRLMKECKDILSYICLRLSMLENSRLRWGCQKRFSISYVPK